MRSTTSKNSQGNTEDRRRRKQYLLDTYRANVDLSPAVALAVDLGYVLEPWQRELLTVPVGEGIPAARCFHCGGLLVLDEISPDRIKPGCLGGSYRRENVRPSCLTCNLRLGGRLGAQRRAS